MIIVEMVTLEVPYSNVSLENINNEIECRNIPKINLERFPTMNVIYDKSTKWNAEERSSASELLLLLESKTN
jgi:hypothetical protein